jgi:hypothetical protein
MLPSTENVVSVELGGRSISLYYSFRAWHSIGVNPLRPEEIQGLMSSLDPEKAAAFIAAGIQGHQRLVKRLCEQDGEQPPSFESWDTDRVLDLMDAAAFARIIEAIGDASPKTKKAADIQGNG